MHDPGGRVKVGAHGNGERGTRRARPDRVRSRLAEETGGTLARLLPRVRDAGPVPEALTETAAVALFRHVATHYQLELIGESVLVQACFALQRANQCRLAIDQDGLVDARGGKAVAHVLLGAERDARALFLRLLDRLGLLE